jgi:predicted transposase/invertase (TIGR01784 family)
MFAAVMSDEENCKGFLERALPIKVDHVEISTEKSIVYHPEYKGVRLDVYAKDENNTRYNVEMQVLKQPALGRRSRYYQSHMDMDLLVKGYEYAELPDSYVIFLCDFDPFGEGKYRYTFRTACEETEEVSLKDGRCIVFLNTRGKNVEDVPKELVSFLRFVHADLKESQKDFEDDYVRQVQKSVTHIRDSREMEERFMLLELLMEDERREGRKEGREEGRKSGQLDEAIRMLQMALSRYGQLPDTLLKTLHQQQDIEIVRGWMEAALEAQSLDDFISKM